jgi:hypothetical protein
MFEVNVKQCQRCVGKWVAEASTLGFPPGMWPNQIRMNISFGMYFEFHEPRPVMDREGDVQAYVYRCKGGSADLHVIND